MSPLANKDDSCQLVFKKAFGIETCSTEMFLWLMELQNSAFQVKSRDLVFSIQCGQIGLNQKEKVAIGLFKHSDERNPQSITPISSLNLSTRVDVQLPDELEDAAIGSANKIIEPYAITAFVALQNFIEAYRDAKYLTLRDTPQWTAELGVFVPEMSFREFKTYLFYSATVNEREFIGSFSEGIMRSISPGDESFMGLVERGLKESVPLPRVLMVRAWEALFEGDFRSAIVESATVIEVCIKKLLTKRLVESGVADTKQVDKFIERTSKRLLLSIIGGLLKIESEKWREEVVMTLETRHALVHGVKRYAKHDEAESAVRHADRFLTLTEEK